MRACHALAGQVVKVLRQTRHMGHDEPRWVVQPPDPHGAPVSLPLSWAVLVDDTTDPARVPIEPADDGPWVDVTHQFYRDDFKGQELALGETWTGFRGRNLSHRFPRDDPSWQKLALGET